MGQTAVIPAWVVPTARAVADCHWIAHAAGNRQVCEVLDWVTGDLHTEQDARERWALLGRVAGLEPAHVTLTWLLGMGKIPPVRLPRRNADGTVVTAEQLYDEYIAGKTGLPEQRLEARNRARKDAALYQQLAAYAHR